MELAGVHLISVQDGTSGVSEAVLRSLTVRGMDISSLALLLDNRKQYLQRNS